MIFRQLVTIIAAAAMLGVPASYGQAFSSGSTGSDGALNFTTPGTIDFDPVALGLDPAGDNIFNFTTINIAAGVTVNMRASKLREKPVVFLATGAVTIAGTLALNGAAGYVNGTADLREPSEPGPSGYPGGIGASISSPPQPGAGPGGGVAYVVGNGASNGNYAGVYGNSLLVPLRGGSGGGGGTGGGGGAGGGAIQLVSSISIAISGSLTANGGATGGVGGGGSGGAVHLEAPVVSGAGSILAIGGQGYGYYYFGPAGSGWTRVDTTTNNFTGTINPAATFGPLYNVPLPSAVPTVMITSINGIAVPSVPTGSFTAPDVTISSGAAVSVAISAANIPIGTVVNLIVSSETDADQIVQASPLAGTVASSTATASIVWPLGVSRIFIRATW